MMIKGILYKIIAVVTLLSVWKIISEKNILPSYLLPSPDDVIKSFIQDWPQIQFHLQYSIHEWLYGLTISILLGLSIAIIAFYSKLFAEIMLPILFISQAIPYIIFAPLLLIWLGFGMMPKIFLVILTCIFPIAISCHQGLKNAFTEYSNIIIMLKIKPLQALRHIYLPAVCGSFFYGLKVSASYGFVSAVMAEWIGSERGLGVYMSRAQNSYRTDRVLAATVIIVAISLITTSICQKLQERIIFWEQAKK